MIELGAKVREKIRTAFSPSDQDRVAMLLMHECADNLPFLEKTEAEDLQRIRLAVITLSQGQLKALQEWIDRAKVDWRDVLKAAGEPQTDTAYRAWRPR